ncbi:unnamed protein product [Tilletia controversa]|uniref:Uncharacterized protein n=3 Tax=Tilletia TaxID=13289 RepID=A0A8X7MZZ3_9BASI|nr:hypothetical protein CF336_g478 [Tilletia laevis]KAE8201103.1 hypothetical protein CF328_g2772 [Tilletia controversa]KAE8265412.1 hypothetical protein A4X03_0g287 [Tilletia caries]KAE8208792.1 hypothetical protein CF335_g156 [Tilletia laevis]KAE8255254.1 hypothetical protein A4X06_0g529 [Tilletia controversa]
MARSSAPLGKARAPPATERAPLSLGEEPSLSWSSTQASSASSSSRSRTMRDEDDAYSARPAKRAKMGTWERSQSGGLPSSRPGKENIPPPRSTFFGSRPGSSTSTPARSRASLTSAGKKQNVKADSNTGPKWHQPTLFAHLKSTSTSSQPRASQTRTADNSATSKGGPSGGKGSQASASRDRPSSSVQPHQQARTTSAVPARLPGHKTARAKGKARAEEPERLSPEPTASRSQTESGEEDTLPESNWEAPPPSTWQKNAAHRLHLYRLVNGTTPQEDDPVFTQVPGDAGKKVVRSIGRQLDFEANKKRREQNKAEAERLAAGTRQRMRGDEVRPFRMHRTRNEPAPVKNKDPEPSQTCPSDESQPTEEEAVPARSPGKERESDLLEPGSSPLRFEPVNLDQRLATLLSNSNKRSGEDGPQNTGLPSVGARIPKRPAGNQPARTYAYKTEDPDSEVNDVDTRSETASSSETEPELPSSSAVPPRSSLQSRKVPVETYAGSTASDHSSPFEAPMSIGQVNKLPQRSTMRTQRESMTLGPETMISESLLIGPSTSDAGNAAQSTSTPPRRNRYIASADIRDNFDGLSPTSRNKVLALDTQFEPSFVKKLVSAGAKGSLRYRMVPAGMEDDEGDEDRTIVGEGSGLVPDKSSARSRGSTNSRKQRSQGSSTEAQGQGSQLSLTNYPGFAEMERKRREKLAAREEERVRKHRERYKVDEHQQAICDRMEGKTDVLDDPSDEEEDADKTKVDPEWGSHERKANKGNFADHTRIRFQARDDFFSIGEPSYSGDTEDNRRYRLADITETQLRPLMDSNAIQAAFQLAIDEEADETQPLPESQMSAGMASSTSSGSVVVPVPASFFRRNRVGRDGVKTLDSEGNSLETIPLAFGSSLSEGEEEGAS